MIITKWKQIINGIFPFKDNHKINNDLKKKMNTIEIDDCLKKEYCLLCVAPIETRDIDVDSIQKIYDSEISRKSILEDKAKTNVIGITIAITLIMGAYGLCNNVYAKITEPFLKFIVFALFVAAALYMILAGIISIRTIVDENIVFMPENNGIGLSEENLREELDICIGKNRIQNIIRNNNIYTSYQYIKNALICLFIVLLISIFPITNQQIKNISQNMNNTQYYYSESAAEFMLENDLSTEVGTMVSKYISSIDKLQKDGVYGFINENKTLFFKIEINKDKITVLSIEPIVNYNER